MRTGVVPYIMAVHELPDVIGIVTSCLHPCRQVVIVQTQFGEPWIAALAHISERCQGQEVVDLYIGQTKRGNVCIARFAVSRAFITWISPAIEDSLGSSSG